MTNKIIKILLTAGLVAFIVFGYWNYNSVKKRIKSNLSISSGRIINYQLLYKSSTGYNYEFISKGVTYKGFYGRDGKVKELIGRFFPVVYNSIDPKENFLLIFPDDFKEYNLYFPDSLNWVLDYD